MTDLEAKFGHLTDKFSLGYFPAYFDLLHYKPRAHILEVGTAGGGSLMLWHELCPDGMIVGVDLHAPAKLPPGALHILSNQSDPDLPGKVAPYGPFDLIIDDASHWGAQSRTTFDNLWPLVRPGGWYVLEDWPVGLEDNPYYPMFGGNSMVRLVQSFITRVKPVREIHDAIGTRLPSGGEGSVAEVRCLYGLAMVRKVDV